MRVAVETLAIGTIVVTATGARRPVKRVGRRGCARQFLAANPSTQPVRFTARSLGDGVPRRNLFVSPQHGMFLDDLLVPAPCLMNGRTITKDSGRETVDYVHIELDSHDVILAEGARSETFFDDGNRGVSHNARVRGALSR